MSDAQPNLPIKVYRAGESIPPVDPDDLRRAWQLERPCTAQSRREACSPGADVSAVYLRSHMVTTLTDLKLLAPWTHGERPDDAVFRLAATFPLHARTHRSYMIPGDEYHPFDPNAFVERLVKETGIAHVWEPVRKRVAEGGRCIITSSFGVQAQVENLERKATQKTRQLLWAIWSRFAGFDELLAREDAEHTSELTSTLFADFLIGNSDLVQRVSDACRKKEGVGMDLLMEVEQRAQRRI